jgi:hypothetical protein
MQRAEARVRVVSKRGVQVKCVMVVKMGVAMNAYG